MYTGSSGVYGAVCVLQVDKTLDLDPESRTAAKEVATETNARHRLWLNRGRRLGAKKLATWRPRPIYRASARNVLRAVDNQFRVLTPSGGLKMFIRVAEDFKWACENWETWPYLALNFDHASEICCAYHGFDTVKRMKSGLTWGFDFPQKPEHEFQI